MKGCVAVFIDKQGRAICSTNDFDEYSFSGFSLKRSQEIRCRNRMATEIVKSYSSPPLYENVKNGTADKVMDDLLSSGFSVHYEFIGHEVE